MSVTTGLELERLIEDHRVHSSPYTDQGIFAAKQLHTGKRHSQNPPSRLRRLVSNVELLGTTENEHIRAAANFIVYESRERGITLWAGRSEYALRRTEEGMRMGAKTVHLVNNDRPLSTLAFLI